MSGFEQLFCSRQLDLHSWGFATLHTSGFFFFFLPSSFFSTLFLITLIFPLHFHFIISFPPSLTARDIAKHVARKRNDWDVYAGVLRTTAEQRMLLRRLFQSGWVFRRREILSRDTFRIITNRPRLLGAISVESVIVAQFGVLPALSSYSRALLPTRPRGLGGAETIYIITFICLIFFSFFSSDSSWSLWELAISRWDSGKSGSEGREERVREH